MAPDCSRALAKALSVVGSGRRRRRRRRRRREV
jgi:hypothetical protein